MQPSLLSLAVLGCDLKLLGCDWLTAVVTLQNLAGVKGGELSVCYEAVAPYYNMVAMQHPLYISSKVPPPPPPATDGPKEDKEADKEERAGPKDGLPVCEVVQEETTFKASISVECGEDVVKDSPENSGVQEEEKGLICADKVEKGLSADKVEEGLCAAEGKPATVLVASTYSVKAIT